MAFIGKSLWEEAIILKLYYSRILRTKYFFGSDGLSK